MPSAVASISIGVLWNALFTVLSCSSYNIDLSVSCCLPIVNSTGQRVLSMEMYLRKEMIDRFRIDFSLSSSAIMIRLFEFIVKILKAI